MTPFYTMMTASSTGFPKSEKDASSTVDRDRLFWRKWGRREALLAQHILYLWNDYYRQFVIIPGMTVIVILGLLCPRTCGSRWKEKKEKMPSLEGIWTRSSQREGTVFIHLTTKDQLADNCTDYLSNLISTYKSLLNSG